jgi:twitching motility protein PilU
MEFTSLLKMMKERRASDLFISAGVPPSLKIDGKLVPVSKTPLTAEQAKIIIEHTMTPLQKRNFEQTSESNFALNLPESGRFRVNVFRHQTQMGMVLRRIETSVPTFEELHLPKIMRDMAMYRHGLVLIVGSTGVGKSTTLATMIQHRNLNSHGHIVSIEDPIEYIHKPENCIITQREIGIDTASYEAALRNTLRQSPDMIVIGEIRSRETMQHALEFAETGHLCLATLHATNSFQAIERIVSFFPEDARSQILLDLSLNLKGIVAQRLVTLKDGSGRRVAAECLLNTPLATSHIRDGDTHALKEVIKKSREQGMQLIDDALFYLYKDGLIDRDEALNHADSSNELRLKIKLLENPSISDTNLSSISLIDKFQ